MVNIASGYRLTLLALFFCLTQACAASNPVGHSVEDKRWNFLVIVVDDLGQMDIRPNNPETFYATPNLANLAQESVRFDHHYAASPVCSPSRYALLTGKTPARAAVTDWFRKSGGQHRSARYLPASMNEVMPLEEVTLAESLRSAGYATAFVGKWHLGEHERYWPENQGFDINVGGYWSGSPRGRDGYFSPYNNPRLADGRDGEYLTARLTSEAIGLIETYARQQSPFLVYLSFYTVHNPLAAPRETVRRYEELVERQGLEPRSGEEEQVWPETTNPRRVRHSQDHPIYAAMVEEMDRQVGRLLSALDESGAADDTVVIFTSDNGGLSTSEGMPTSNLPYRGGKGWVYEGGIRVPLVIRWPGRARTGVVDSTPLIAMDVFPTILEIAGVQHGETDGKSLVSLLEGTATPSVRPLFWHYPHYSNQGGFPASAVRLGRYKLIRRLEDGRTHLYDLIDDPGETHDLSAEFPDKTRELTLLLDEWYSSVDARFLQPGPERIDDRPWRPHCCRYR